LTPPEEDSFYKDIPTSYEVGNVTGAELELFSSPAPVAEPRRPAEADRAKVITDAYWEHYRGRLTQPYVAILKVVRTCTANGIDDDVLKRAMARCTDDGWNLSAATISRAIAENSGTVKSRKQKENEAVWAAQMDRARILDQEQRMPGSTGDAWSTYFPALHQDI
jgi:hypothetical protein